ncbi:MAG TPA: DUF4386 domain-containing protein [Microthrixaceae bacterium]|mgnify:CR=1 FL=1|nr:DUF4386 domain-containing protein [Microthrixaceae bacterium]HMT23095.1 DUF4386 domain-containing protein [Microthrixaceae bacterium]
MTGHVDRTRPGRAEPEGGPVVEPRPGRAARLGGVLYLVTFASSIPAVLLLAPVLDRVGFVTESGSDVRVLVGCLLDVVNALACVGTAVALWPVVARTHPTLALGFLASRIIEGAVIMIGVVCLLGVVTLRRDVGGAGADPSLVHVARALVAVRGWTFLLGPGLMPSINAGFLASALHRTAVVPRVIPMLGLVGAPLLLASTLVTYFNGNHQIAAVAAVGVAPIFLWELSLGLRLAIRGLGEPTNEPALQLP